MLVSKSTLSALSHAVSTDEARYNLNGYYLEPARITATDGHRLARVTFAEADPELASHPPVILAADGVAALAKLLKKGDTARIHNGAADGSIAAEANGVDVPLARIDGEFPDCEMLVKKYGQRTPVASVTLRPKYLRDVADAAEKLGAKGVVLDLLPDDPAYKVGSITISATPAPARFTASVEGASLFALVMPIRL